MSQSFALSLLWTCYVNTPWVYAWRLLKSSHFNKVQNCPNAIIHHWDRARRPYQWKSRRLAYTQTLMKPRPTSHCWYLRRITTFKFPVFSCRFVGAHESSSTCWLGQYLVSSFANSTVSLRDAGRSPESWTAPISQPRSRCASRICRTHHALEIRLRLETRCSIRVCLSPFQHP